MKKILLTAGLLLSIFLPVFAQDEVVEKKLEQLAAKLAEGLRAQGKTRVAVSDLTDLQSFPTELGKFLSDGLQGNLVPHGIRVINRARFNELLAENELSTKGLLDSRNSARLQKATGIDVVVIGTTTPFDKVVNINLLALDLEKAEAIASAKTTIPRTQSIDLLITTVLRNGIDQGKAVSLAGAVQASAPGGGAEWEKALAKSICHDRIMGQSGTYCFDNRFNVPVLLYEISSGNVGIMSTSILISPGNTGCAPMISVGNNATWQKNFYFRTVNEPIKKGFLTLTVEGCKEKHVTLSPSNFYMEDVPDRR